MNCQPPRVEGVPPQTEVVGIVPSSSFLHQVEEASGEKVSLCYQCRKCSSGCPVTFAMDYLPHVVLRMVQLGLRDRVLSSGSIWICASCETCTTRCPNEIGVAAVMDALRRMALKAETAREVKLPPSVKDIAAFHSAFLGSIRAGGRVHEVGMLARYILKDNLWARKGFLHEIKLGWEMFRRGKLGLLPHRMHQADAIARLFERSRR